MNIKRGDIYYVHKTPYCYGSEQYGGRPAIIVSNNKCNENAEVVEVVYLTTKPKKDLPTHVKILSAPKESTALCEQISTISIDRIGEYIGHITAQEATNLEIAMLVSLDMTTGEVKEKIVTKEVIKEVPVNAEPEKLPPAASPVSGSMDFEGKPEDIFRPLMWFFDRGKKYKINIYFSETDESTHISTVL